MSGAITDAEDKPKNPVYRSLEEARKAGATGLIDIDPTLPEKPLPCPFCGGEPEIKNLDQRWNNDEAQAGDFIAIECTNEHCHAQPDVNTYGYRLMMAVPEQEKAAIKKWNTRDGR